MPAKDPTAAERQRRYRYRRKRGLLLAQADVPTTLAEGLIDAGLLSEDGSLNARALGAALVAAAQRLLNGAC